jgi:hypothetical protein
MKVSRKLFALTALILVTAVPHSAAPQGITSLLASARGDGTLKVGQEVFKVSTVVVNLKEDGTGEVTLVTDLQLFLQCTWTAPAELSKGIDLKITGGATAGGATGSGKLFLKPDEKSIVSLTIEATSNTVKRKIEVKFVAAG